MLEYQLNLTGVNCAVVEWNPQASQLLFAFHGWLDNLSTFEALAAHLTDFRIVAVDMPGHGHSEHLPDGMPYHFYNGIYLIDDLLNHFQQQSAVLLGHSMGGALSIMYAASQGDRVKAVISIESIGPLTADGEQMLTHFKQSVEQRAELTLKEKPRYSNFDQALKVRATVSKIDPSLIAPIVERGLVRIGGEYTWRADSRLRVVSPIRLAEEHLGLFLTKIECPILLIEGSNGFLVDNLQFKKRKMLINNLKTNEYDGGHHVHLEQPELIAADISRFCASLVGN